MIREEHQKYWNKVCNQAIREEGGLIYNFFKLQQILHRLFRFPFWDGKIMEIGCGAGVIGLNLRNVCNVDYMGIEISDEYIKHCTEFYKLNVQKATVTDIPIMPGSVDYVFAFDVLEHIHPDDRYKAYSEIGRILKQDGTMLINNPVAETKSGHDASIEFGFDLRDLYVLLDLTGLKLTQIERYRIVANLNGGKDVRDYEWMVLQRMTKKSSEEILNQTVTQAGDQSALSTENSGN